MLLSFRACGLLFDHRRSHVRGLDYTSFEVILIHGMDPVNEVQVSLVGGIEIVAERALDESIYQVAIPDKELEMKLLDQQRQDVLSADSSKSLLRTIPVAEFPFKPLQLMVVLVLLEGRSRSD